MTKPGTVAQGHAIQALGGVPVAALKEGDIIHVDIPEKKLWVELSDELATGVRLEFRVHVTDDLNLHQALSCALPLRRARSHRLAHPLDTSYRGRSTQNAASIS